MLRARFNDELKAAMKAKDPRAVSTVRLILAALKDRDIAARSRGITEGIGDDEIGDLLFAIANIARKLDVNAEEALQSANRKFTRRFTAMESRARGEDKNLDQLTLEQMDALWDEAKAAERS